MLNEETIGFLRNVTPFDKLTDDELAAVASDIMLEYYPRGVKILRQDGPPSDYLRIIKKGGVKVYLTSKDGEEIVIDYRGESEQFGMLSVVGGDHSRANVVAVEDTICYLISRDRVLSLFQANPVARDYFLKSFFINFIDKTYEETRRKYSGSMGESDRLLYTTPVGDIVKNAPVTAPLSSSIQEAAAVMAEHRVSSLILVDAGGIPTGIITDRDMRNKVVAPGRDITGPVRQIMSSPLIRVDAEEYCFEALLKMMRHKIHHIIVIEKGMFKGIVTNHDFMVLQGSSPTVLAREMEEVHSIESLTKTTPKLYKTVASLMREGARAHNITGLITELVEKMVTRTVAIIEEKIGPAPHPYALFMYGDGARRELCLDFRLRLGVVYPDTNNLNVVKGIESYFDRFVCEFEGVFRPFETFDSAGVLPRENLRAFTEWKDRFNSWKYESRRARPQPEFFDMRPLLGESALVDTLREHLFTLAASSENLLHLIATEAVTNRPPLGFFKRFVVEKSGEHKNELDLYHKGIRPIVDSLRIFCLEKGLRELQSINRVRELGELHRFEHAGDVEHSLSYLSTLILHTQLQQLEQGFDPDSFVNPEELSPIERKTLKEVFHLTTKLYDILERSYRTERSS